MKADAVRVAAAKALYKIDKAEAIKALESATQCQHAGVRFWATKTLENLNGGNAAVPANPPTTTRKRFAEPSGRFKEPSGRFKQ